MKKTIASISAAAVIFTSSLSAWVPAAAADIGVTSDLTYASEYVFRGYELLDHSLQPSLEVSMGDFYVGFFANQAISNTDPGTELQYYGGLALAIPGMEQIVLDLGVTVYHWSQANLNRTHEGFVGTKFSDVGIPGLSAAVYYFYDTDRRAHAVEGGIGYSFALDMAGMSTLDLSAMYGNQFGSSIRNNVNRPRVDENHHYYGASAELPYRLNEFSTVTLGAHYQTAEGATLDNYGVRGKNFFWTVSYTAGF